MDDFRSPLLQRGSVASFRRKPMGGKPNADDTFTRSRQRSKNMWLTLLLCPGEGLNFEQEGDGENITNPDYAICTVHSTLRNPPQIFQ